MSSTYWEELAGALAAVLGTDAVSQERPVGPDTTYRVGGAARVGASLSANADFAALAEVLRQTPAPLLVVGKGSNLLVADEGFEGVALWLERGFDWVEIKGQSLRAGAGVSLAVLARQSSAANLTGFEWAVGVPGSLGGGVRMNAGGHGADMAASLQSAQVVDLASGTVQCWDAEQFQLGYRSSALAPHHLVLSAEMRLAYGDAARSQELIGEIVAWRREHQPGGQNAGSVFTNPSGDNAGRLIEAVGLKGRRRGSAQVSPKHANFIVVDRGGSANDVFELMCEVFLAVQAKFAIALVPETQLMGFVLGPWAD